MPSLRLVIFLLLCFVVVNLFIGLFRIMRGKRDGDPGNVVRALTIRVAASVVLFAIILLAIHFSSSSA